jgi:hypothetical protein
MYPNGFGMKERYYFQKARGAMVVDGYPKERHEASKTPGGK